MDNQHIEQYVDSFERGAKGIKDEIFRIAWAMRGGVSSHDLMHVYSQEDRNIMSKIIQENIDSTKRTGMALI